MTSDSSTAHRVLIAGGGVAGLEALLALRDLAGDRVALTLLAPERQFTYRPMAVGVPFARGHMQRHDLADVARATGAEFVRGELAEVDVPARERRPHGRPPARVRRAARRRRRRGRARLQPRPHVDPGARPGGLRRPARRPRGGLCQARGLRRPARRRLAAAGLRAGADDRVGRARHGPGRRRGHGLHAGGGSARRSSARRRPPACARIWRRPACASRPASSSRRTPTHRPACSPAPAGHPWEPSA